jgi:hypothetical protein
LALSVELKQCLSLGRHEDTSCLLHGRPLTEILTACSKLASLMNSLFLLQPPEALRLEGGQDRRLLRVTGDLLLLAPLHRLLRRISLCVCYEHHVPLVDVGVAGDIGVEVELDVRLRRL